MNAADKEITFASLKNNRQETRMHLQRAVQCMSAFRKSLESASEKLYPAEKSPTQ